MSTAFSVVVIGDTQYLFDGDRLAPDLLSATLRQVTRLVAAGAVAPVRHVVHVGDVTEHGWAPECESALTTLTAGQRALGGQAWTIATGNHDVAGRSEEHGPSPFLDTFGPGCALLAGEHLRTTVEHSADGYSSWRALRLPGSGSLGLLALDWQPTSLTWDWAGEVLARHREVPTVVVSHDAAAGRELTPQGHRIQEWLQPHPQVFLVLAGHHWPSARVIAGGREYHAVNHQQLPFGGAGTVRLYEFDPAKGEGQVITLTAALHDARVLRSVEARRQLSLARPEDQFRFTLPATLGGSRPTPWQAAGMHPVLEIHPAGECEFEARLNGTSVIELECELPPTAPNEWEVLLARLGTAPDSAEPLAALSLSSENFLGWQAAVAGGQTWTTSHEHPPGAALRIVVRHGFGSGMWIDDDLVGRTDGRLADPMLAGPWRWRLGAGEYGGRRCDEFGGTVRRLRMWRATKR